MDFPEIPGYEIKSRLGKGGMATIYLAEQTNFRRMVALKIMLSHLSSDPSFTERFMREARNVAKMNHPNFVPVYDVGQHGGQYYLSMEYLPTGDLKAHMREGISLSDGVRIIKEVADALNYADQKNFVHRDIKPENILLRENLSAVVCDFGIAKEINEVSQMTMMGTVIGTPRYMSPEQAQAAELDGRSDLYSLGVIFFEMLAGHVPYDGGSALDIAIKHINEPIPRLPAKLAAFQPFIDVALAKQPEHRFQTGREMINALEELEESHFVLIHESSITVLVPESELNSSRHKLRTGPSRYGSRAVGSSGFRTGGSVPRRRARPARKPEREFIITWRRLAPVLAAALLTLGGTAWWLYSRNVPESTPVIVEPTPVTPTPILPGIAKELREKAERALTEGRLFGPGDDNAHGYLTALLILQPEDSGGKASITRLYGIYLERASQALELGDLGTAQETLEQAGKISHYVQDESLIGQQSRLQRNLMDAQAQSKINAKREQLIERLLAEADALRDSGKLTSPADENAFGRYQEVLSLDPSNETAIKGIEAIAGTLLAQAREQLESGQVGRANAFLAAAGQIFPKHPELASTRAAIKAEELRLQELESQELAKRTEAQEMEQARRAQERQLRAKKVQSLLAEASSDVQADRLSSPENNNAVEKYNQVLNLDPANVDALTGLENVANRHIEIALAMIKGGELEDAEWNLTRAKMLSPVNPKYTAAQAELIAVRDLALQQAAAENARKEKITSLVSRATLSAKEGKLFQPNGDNAIDYIRQVLELDGRNASALALRAELNNRIETATASEIKSQRFDNARLAIDALASNKASEQAIAGLRKQLKSAEQIVARRAEDAGKLEQARREAINRERLAQENAAAEKVSREKTSQQRVKDQRQQQAQQEEKASVRSGEIGKLLAEARELGGPDQVTAQNYRRLVALYDSVLRLDPANATAVRGKSSATDFAAKLAESAIAGGDYQSAASLIEYLGEISPDSPAPSRLRDQLAIKQRKQEQVTEILAAADVLTATPYQKPGLLGNNDQARNTLRMAFAKIQSARAIDEKMPAIEASEQKLARKYLDIISIHLNDRHLEEVREFLPDLVDTGLAPEQLATLQQRIQVIEDESKSKSRPAVGSF